MKIKLDENIPDTLAAVLTDMGHDTDTIPDENLSGKNDKTVFEATQNEGRFFITQDLDFSDIRVFMPGSHAGLMLVRMRTPGRSAIIGRVREIFVSEDVSDWAGAFVVLTEKKLRLVKRTNTDQSA